mmetsp:Transcript_18388/g.24514  ORF Transcript_18388/g.24514 Transcript_18388/m.24514 type:complete len:811 (+) Transcript_18388:21-2453(+)
MAAAETAPTGAATHENGIAPTATTTSPQGPGTILVAAFVDPAYSWPPEDGQGKNAIELQASTALLLSASDTKGNDIESDDDDADSLATPPQPKLKARTKVISKTEIVETSRCGFFRCCKNTEEHVVDTFEKEEIDQEEIARLKAEWEEQRGIVREKRKEREALKKERHKARLEAIKKRQEIDREKERYSHVPEGILIYRLDTSDRTVTLLSSPSSNTDVITLMRHMVVSKAEPSNDSSRRGIVITSVDGAEYTIMACEQRTAIAWLEAMNMMFGNKNRKKNSDKAARAAGVDKQKAKELSRSKSGVWAKEKLNDKERDHIEEQYVALAAYSNNLIRAGAIPGQESEDKKKRADSSGVYYSVTTQVEEGDDYDEETLESIAKRRAVVRDSWDFYRMICSLLRDRRKYDEVFRRMQLDPVYPYLNSMTGLNDPGDSGYENTEKEVMQKDLEEYMDMTPSQVTKDLVRRAEEALPSLVEICKALAGSLGMEEVGVGPIKEVSAALRKAEKKYEGDILKVTDYCRALLVVKDFPTLLALLELARDSFGPLIRRVKLSTLKDDHTPLPGGYRDCKINLELKDHICEIQVHIWPMWVVCGVDGFRHYRHCLEYSTDTFGDPYDALAGLDRKTMAELIVVAEEAVADMPLESLEWYHEKFILDYFAEVGLFLKHDLLVWAEVTLRSLIKLRCESPDIGPDHHETLQLQKYLEKALRKLGKEAEADEVATRINEIERLKQNEEDEAEKTLWEYLVVDPIDMLMDPNKKEREEEEKLKKEVKASKKAWRKIRDSRFKFLDTDLEHASMSTGQTSSEHKF